MIQKKNVIQLLHRKKKHNKTQLAPVAPQYDPRDVIQRRQSAVDMCRDVQGMNLKGPTEKLAFGTHWKQMESSMNSKKKMSRTDNPSIYLDLILFRYESIIQIYILKV